MNFMSMPCPLATDMVQVVKLATDNFIVFSDLRVTFSFAANPGSLANLLLSH
jgi:hypothetical protein